MKIGLMGGTFDPIHNAHIAIAQEAMRALTLDKILFIPAGAPPHKLDMADKHHRLEMTKLAVSNHPKFCVSPIEIQREGVTYTVDTLKQLNATSPGCKFYYVVGADTLMVIETWHNIENVMELCDIIAFHRESVASHSLLAQADRLCKRFSKKPLLLPVSAPDISSTAVRERIALGKPVDDMVPAIVVEYISKHRLYEKR